MIRKKHLVCLAGSGMILAMGSLLVSCATTPMPGDMAANDRPPKEMSPPGPGAPPSGEHKPPAKGMSPVLAEKESSDCYQDLGPDTAAINAYVDALCKKKIFIQGAQNREFLPGQDLLSEDFLMMLSNRNRQNAGPSAASREPQQDLLTWATANDIIRKQAEYRPQSSLTRLQMVVWMYRAELAHGMPKEMISTDCSGYSDVEALSQEERQALATLTRLHIVAPDEKGMFNPAARVLRKEVVVPLYRLSCLGGGPGGKGGPGGSGGPGGPGGPEGSGGPGGPGHSMEVNHGTAAVTLDQDVHGGKYASTGDAENALRVSGKEVLVEDVNISKTGGRSEGGDSSNFYGSNAGFLIMDGGNVTGRNIHVETSAEGANGIFAYGEGTQAKLNTISIQTRGNSSGGIMVAGGAAVSLIKGEIETWGRSSAALRSDRGGGRLQVVGGEYIAHGQGSPAIYSTAAIKVADARLTATSSEAVVIEGKNSVYLKDCHVTGEMRREGVENLQNVMIYQSMSGDAEQGRSSFVMEGGSLRAKNGDMFYVTNTSCDIEITSVALQPANDTFLRVVGNDARTGWGVAGKNGGDCRFVAKDQKISGNVIVDDISSLTFSLADSSHFTGAIQMQGKKGNVSVTLDSGSSWELTGDSSVSSLQGDLSEIKTGKYKLLVNGVPFVSSQKG